jgi:uncharacterized membrane protein
MSNLQSRLNSISQNGYNFKLSDYISQGFNVFSKNAGLFVIFICANLAISIILGIIPLLGQLVSFLISSALIAGFYIVADKTYNNENVSFSNFFDGFNAWAQLFLTSLLSGLLIILAILPAIFYLIITIGFSGLTEIGDISESPLGVLTSVNIFIVFILFFLGALVGLLFIYAPLFVYFEELSAWDAIVASAKIVSKNIFMHLIFGIVWAFIMLISVIPLGLGLLATVPAYFCSVYVAWRDITGYSTEDVADDDDILRHLID